MVTADAMKELQMRMKVRDLSFSRDSTSWKNIPFISLWKRFPRLDGFRPFDFFNRLGNKIGHNLRSTDRHFRLTLSEPEQNLDTICGPVFHSSPIKWSAS